MYVYGIFRNQGNIETTNSQIQIGKATELFIYFFGTGISITLSLLWSCHKDKQLVCENPNEEVGQSLDVQSVMSLFSKRTIFCDIYVFIIFYCEIYLWIYIQRYILYSYFSLYYKNPTLGKIKRKKENLFFIVKHFF